MSRLKILSGSVNEPLTDKIVQYYDKEKQNDASFNFDIVGRKIERFNDGEFWIEINDNIRGQDVFLIQPTQVPVNDSVMELLVMLDAIRRSSPQRVTAVLPYFGYARQDRKTTPRSPISAKLVSKLIEQAGADRVLTVDLHASQIQGFFEIPVDHLYATSILARHLSNRKDEEKLVIVAPDVGAVARARAFAKHFECDLAIIDKRRPKAGVSEVMHIIGNVEGAHCVLFDDICDSGGTLCNAANELMQKGAKKVDAYISHGVFSAPCVARVEQSVIRKIVVTDSIYHNVKTDTQNIASCSKIEYQTMGDLLGEAIYCIHKGFSVSKLFNY